MTIRPLVLCPVDFSDASRGALRYAAALSEHFHAGLMVLTVDDPLLVDAVARTRGEEWLKARTQQELEEFVKETFRSHQPLVAELQLMVASGKPAPQINRMALEHRADVIVMSSHGKAGVPTPVFGSTTERVLRETRTPVLVTPAADPGPDNLDDIRTTVRTVVAPVDLTPATPLQVRIARGLAEALDVTLVVAHVIEPPHASATHHEVIARLDVDRRRHAHAALTDLMATLPPGVRSEIVLGYGDPAEQIARIAQDRQPTALVMGLHSSTGAGPRMGSVTYRVLCQVSAPILAVPPAIEKMASRRLALARTEALA